MKKSKIILIVLAISVMLITFFGCSSLAMAESLKEEIDKQLGIIQIDELENYFNGLDRAESDGFLEIVYKLVNGEVEFSFNTIFQFIIQLFFNSFSEQLPIFLTVIAIVIITSFISSSRSGLIRGEIVETINFVATCAIILLIVSDITLIIYEVKNTIENLSNLCNIMSPIMMTLMVGSGGVVSAGIYKPIVALFSGGVINLICIVFLPLLEIIFIFRLVGNLSPNFRIGGFADVGESFFKWCLGIIFTIFGIFITIQGISSATFDGISIKTAKYALSNSIPIIGGFLSSGVDLVLAGSVLIKNAVGIASIVAIFYSVISVFIKIVGLNLLFRITSACSDVLGNDGMTKTLRDSNKCLTYFNVVLLLVSFMFFIIVLLLIFSASTIL